MNNIVTCIYMYYYAAIHAPKTWLKYNIYCNMKGKQPDLYLMYRLITVAKTIKSLRKSEYKSKDNNTSVNNFNKLHYKCN